MLPPQQRLGSDDVVHPVLDPDDRLVVQAQLVAGDRRRELLLQGRSVPAGRGSLVGAGDLVAAALLGDVHRGVGGAQEPVGAALGAQVQRRRRRWWSRAAPGRRPGRRCRSCRRPGWATSCAQARSGTSASRTANSSPPSRPDAVAGAQAAAQPGRDLAQQLVAGGVAEHVVDLLEAVEVAEEHGDAGRRPGQARRPWSRRSPSSTRLGSPVRSSCSDWCLIVSTRRALYRAVAAESATPVSRAVRSTRSPGAPSALPQLAVATPSRSAPASSGTARQRADVDRGEQRRERRGRPGPARAPAAGGGPACRPARGGPPGAAAGSAARRRARGVRPCTATVRSSPAELSQSRSAALLQPTMPGSAAVTTSATAGCCWRWRAGATARAARWRAPRRGGCPSTATSRSSATAACRA